MAGEEKIQVQRQRKVEAINRTLLTVSQHRFYGIKRQLTIASITVLQALLNEVYFVQQIKPKTVYAQEEKSQAE